MTTTRMPLPSRARSPLARPHRVSRERAEADHAYRTFKLALRPYLGRDPRLAPRVVRQATRLRAALLARLRLPATRHNVDRLVASAAAGLSLRGFLRDVDRPLPAPIRRDEALFLAALAAHCAARGIRSTHGRRSEAEALLDLPHDDRSSPIVGAWLEGALPWADLALWSRGVGVAA